MSTVAQEIEAKEPGSAARAFGRAKERPKNKKSVPIETAFLVPLELIIAGDQPRKTFGTDEDKSLENSIHELRSSGGGIAGTGVQQAVKLRPHPERDGYNLIVSGERRFRAASNLGLPVIPAFIENVTKDDAYVEGILENLQRADLLPLEEANAFVQVMESGRLDVPALAKKLGASVGYVENRLRLLTFKKDVQEMVTQRPDTISVSRIIDKVPDKQIRQQLEREVIHEGATYKDVKAKVEQLAKTNKIPSVNIGRPSTAAKLPAFNYVERANQANSFLSSLIVAMNDVPPTRDRKAEFLRELEESKRLVGEIEKLLTTRREIGEEAT